MQRNMSNSDIMTKKNEQMVNTTNFYEEKTKTPLKAKDKTKQHV